MRRSTEANTAPSRPFRHVSELASVAQRRTGGCISDCLFHADDVSLMCLDCAVKHKLMPDMIVTTASPTDEFYHQLARNGWSSSSLPLRRLPDPVASAHAAFMFPSCCLCLTCRVGFSSSLPGAHDEAPRVWAGQRHPATATAAGGGPHQRLGTFVHQGSEQDRAHAAAQECNRLCKNKHGQLAFPPHFETDNAATLE